MKTFRAPPLSGGSAGAVGFSVNGIDRLAQVRDDEAFAAAALRDERTWVILFAGEAPVVRRDPEPSLLFPLREAQAKCPLGEPVCLGRRDDLLILAAPVVDSSWTPPPGCEAADARMLAAEGGFEPRDLGLLAEAKSLLSWHSRSRYCSNCGAETKMAGFGWRRECAPCGAQHFPRTDPVVIMLAVHEDLCLLGRQARFAKGVYSALAGFVEPGETAEAAVRREIREEAGIETAEVVYVGSQPWPFPSSLMLGFFAEASSTRLVIDHAELEDARWFSRSEVAAMMDLSHPDGLRPPNPVAIAHTLMQAWLRL